MFFIGIFGTNSKVDPVGGALASQCPVCRQDVFMNVCKNYNYFHAFFLPIYKYNKVYICTCPSCASLFELNNDKGRLLEQTGNCVDDGSGLRLIKNQMQNICRDCGYKISPNANYCQNCGKQI